MQVILDHEEIVGAIKTYVRTLVNVAEGHDMEIELKAGRGENGYSATLDIVPANNVVEATVAPTAAPEVRQEPTAKDGPVKVKAAPGAVSLGATSEDLEEVLAEEMEAEAKGKTASKTARKSAFTLKDEEPEASEDDEIVPRGKPAPKAGTIFSKVKEA